MALPAAERHPGAVASGREGPVRLARTRPWLALLALITASGGTALALAGSGAPFVWITALWTVALAVAAWCIRDRRVRVLLVNLAAAVFAVGVFEAYLWLVSPSADAGATELRYSADYFEYHPVLGYAPRKGIRTQAVKRHRGEDVYRATYTIGDDGLRVTPSAAGSAPRVLFFGGSVTFGEGLDDAETMPYRVAVRAGGAVRSHNFGFHGYGPHQMLAALERGLVQSVVTGPVSTVVYQAIPAHVARAAGRAPWDRQGPWYRLDETGRARFAGRFSDRFGAALAAVLQRSLTFRRVLGHERRSPDADVSLLAAIVDRAREESARLFPGSRFVVILWGRDQGPDHQRVSDALAARELVVHPIGAILPHYVDDPTRYHIGAHDAHPNAVGQDLIARYVVERIIGDAGR